MKTILLDLDGVVVDFVGSFLRCYRKAGGIVPADLRLDWGFDQALRDEDARFAAWHDPSLFRDAEPFPGAVEAVVKLSRWPLDVEFLTSCLDLTGHHATGKALWIARHFFSGFDQPHERAARAITLTTRKELVRGDIFIDDHAPYVLRWLARNPGGKAYLIARPWNARHRDEVISAGGQVWDGELATLADVLIEGA